MRLNYTLTLADYNAAQHLHNQQTLFRRLNSLFWYQAIPAAALAGLTALVFLWPRERSQYIASIAGIEGMLIWLTIYLPVMRYYQTRKCFKQLFPANRSERSSSIDIDEERILSGIPGISEGKFFWKAITGFAQDDRITLLYVSKKRFLFFPTSALTPEQRTELTAIVERQIEKST